MPEIQLPDGWTMLGELPAIDPETAADEDMELLGEDMLQIRTPTGEVIDVGWHPEMERSGCYVCRNIRRGDWENPDEVVETRDPRCVQEWVSDSMNRLSQVLGAGDEDFGPPVVTVEVPPIELVLVLGEPRPASAFSAEPPPEPRVVGRPSTSVSTSTLRN